MNNSIKIIIGCLLVLLVFGMCRQKSHKAIHNEDTGTSGTAQFVADESFRPILDQEIYVFKASYTETKPEFVYKTENDALRLYLNDSIRTAILARDLRPNELEIMKNKNLSPEITRFAIDAVAVIVNQSSPDTLFSVGQLKAILNGKTMTDKNIVFDNPNSSLVRYLKELAGEQSLKQKNVYALKSNKDVIKYVSQHPEAIGIVGFSWLDDPDKDYADAVAKTRIAGIRDENSKKWSQEYFKPSQTTLALKQYPLSRNLYVINSTGRAGLASAFAAFLGSERGQIIILKSGLLPDSLPSREVNIVK